MPLTPEQVKSVAKQMLDLREAERSRLVRIRMYVRDEPGSLGKVNVNGVPMGPSAWLPNDAPDNIKRLASVARVNMLKFVVDATVQVMYVDGYRTKDSSEDSPEWQAWQLNRLDARQIGVHRSTLTYGQSFATILPGDTGPAIRGASAHKMTVAYDSDGADWPKFAIERRRSATQGRHLWRLFDESAVYWLETDEQGNIEVLPLVQEHGMGVTPVVRFRNTIDDDEDGEGASPGEVEPLIAMQDQINLTTFGLLVAQHYGAFRQRYILGWMAQSENQALSASARKLWTFDDPDVTVGEFSQTDLSGYIASREATLRHLATVSQTPAHELLGQLANLSAEALAAAEANHRRKVLERQTVMGEGWEQVFELAGRLLGTEFDPMAQVRWRDTEARSLAATADALGKMAQTLGIPPQALWERIPGVTAADVTEWKQMAKENPPIDPIAALAAQLSQQAVPAAPAV